MSKRIVILGGGFAGVSAAKAVEGKSNVSVTLISDKNFLHLKWAALRAAINLDKTWESRSMIPLSECCKKTTIVIAKITKVDETSVTIEKEGKAEVIPFDGLIIATGSRSLSLAEPPSGKSSAESLTAYYQSTRMYVANAKKIVIVGAGPVALETIGEIVALYGKKAKQIYMIQGKQGMLQNTKPPFPEKFVDAMKNKISTEFGVTMLNDAAPFAGDKLTSDACFIPEGGKFTLESGKVLDGVDLVIYCLGSKLHSTDMYPSKWQDAATKEIKVDPKSMQVIGASNVFAAGDVATTTRTKLGYHAVQDGAVAAKNLANVLLGKQASVKAGGTGPAMMVIPLGPYKGYSLLPFGAVGDYMTSLIKGKGLFANMYWKQFTGKPAPTAPEMYKAYDAHKKEL